MAQRQFRTQRSYVITDAAANRFSAVVTRTEGDEPVMTVEVTATDPDMTAEAWQELEAAVSLSIAGLQALPPV